MIRAVSEGNASCMILCNEGNQKGKKRNLRVVTEMTKKVIWL